MQNLIVRGNRYSFHIKIPKDVQRYFGGRIKFVKALKTDSLADAKFAADILRAKFTSSFTLLRAGLLSDEQMLQLQEELTGVKGACSRTTCLLSELFSQYMDESGDGWSVKTRHEFESIFAVVLEMLGDKDIADYTRQDIVGLRGGLLASGRQPKTCNKYLSLVSSSFKWAVKNEMLKTNRAEALSCKVTSRADLERKRFSADDLQKIVAFLPQEPEKPWKVWIPLIAMYSGMRREEICQLSAGDIRLVDGVWVIDVNSRDGKSLKTSAAERLVPVHSALIKLGFLEMAKKVDFDSNLLGLSKWQYQWGKEFGNWWTRFFIRKLIDDPLKCFHSFRHSFIDELKQQDENESIIAELVGHKVSSMTFGRYGKRYNPLRLKQAVERVSYDVCLTEVSLFLSGS